MLQMKDLQRVTMIPPPAVDEALLTERRRLADEASKYLDYKPLERQLGETNRERNAWQKIYDMCEKLNIQTSKRRASCQVQERSVG